MRRAVREHSAKALRRAFVPLLLMSLTAYSQSSADAMRSRFAVSLGMGAGVHSAPFLVDYMNAFRPSPSSSRLDEFSSMLELFVTPEYRVHPEWNVGLEYSVLIKTQSLGNGPYGAVSEFAYKVHMPTALLRYVVSDPAYYLKVGGGLGYHVATLQQTLSSFGVDERYTTTGVGVKIEAVGNTKFDETFYGSIGVDLRWDFLGTFKNTSGAEAYERTTNTTARMQFFSISLKFGVLFQL
jgi:hypothetical protein